MKYKKIISLSLLVMTSSLFAIDGYCAKTKAHEESIDGIVAVVNDLAITQMELDTAMTAFKKQASATGMSLPPAAELRKQMLMQLVNHKLQLQIAEQGGIKATDEQVTKAIGMVAAQNKMTTKELYEQVAKQGMSISDYRKEIHEEIIIQQMEQQEIGSRINVTPEEVEIFMHSSAWQNFNNKEYHLEDILIALPENPSTQDVANAKKKAEEVLAKIRKGMSFSELAVADSGSSGALQGGDLGWRKLPQIPSAFSNELVHMKKNEIMGPVQTPNGFHIVRLEDLRNVSKQTNAAEERKQIQQLLYQRKFEEGIQAWLTKARAAAFINLHPES